MSATDELQNDALDRLIAELGIAREPISVLLDQARSDLNAAKRIGDTEQARILQKTQRWLEVLEKQNNAIYQTAEILFDLCCTMLEGPKEDVLEGLRWTLIGFEHLIEAQQPLETDTPARFHVRWEGIKGVGFWRTEATETPHTSIFELVRDAAETDGNFSRATADLIATTMIGELRSGHLQLTRLKMRQAESTLEEAVFDLVPRGTASTVGSNVDDAAERVAFDNENDDRLIATELEARLGEDASELAALLDEAACETAAVDYQFCLAAPPSISDWFTSERLSQVSAHTHGQSVLQKRIRDAARQYHQSPSVIVNCLAAIASYKVHSCHLAGDFEGAFVYGNTLRTLAPIILSEAR